MARRPMTQKEWMEKHLVAVRKLTIQEQSVLTLTHHVVPTYKLTSGTCKNEIYAQTIVGACREYAKLKHIKLWKGAREE